MAELGNEVQDLISGFRGIVVAKHDYLNGCTRMTVQPAAKGNVLPESATFDEPQLKVIKVGKAKYMAGQTIPHTNGGPAPYLPKPRAMPGVRPSECRPVTHAGATKRR